MIINNKNLLSCREFAIKYNRCKTTVANHAANLGFVKVFVPGYRRMYLFDEYDEYKICLSLGIEPKIKQINVIEKKEKKKTLKNKNALITDARCYESNFWPQIVPDCLLDD